jgi:pimeloyl-ACP methyl ester carboxylesterase
MPFSELSTIRTPVFLVSGNTGFVLKEHTEKILKSLPNAQMRVLPGGSRNITQTKNDAFLSIMDAFFGK